MYKDMISYVYDMLCIGYVMYKDIFCIRIGYL